MPADLAWVKASTKTVRGVVRSEWSKNQQNYNLNVQVPVGSTATVYVLAKNPDQIKEGLLPIGKVKNATFLRMENDYAVFQIGSGAYRFVSVYTEKEEGGLKDISGKKQGRSKICRPHRDVDSYSKIYSTHIVCLTAR